MDDRHKPGMDSSDSVYISLIRSQAENYILAMRANEPDLFSRRDELMWLLSPNMVLELCNAWKKLQEIQRDEEDVEIIEAFDEEE